MGRRPALGRAALRLPAPGPPLRGAILQAAVAGTGGGGGHCGAEARRQDGSPASCSQVRAGTPRPGPTCGPHLPDRPRGACRAHEAGLAWSPRAVTGPAARPALPHPGPSPRSPHPRATVAAGPVDARRPPAAAAPPDPLGPRGSQPAGRGAATRPDSQAAPRAGKRVVVGSPRGGLAAAACSPALGPRVLESLSPRPSPGRCAPASSLPPEFRAI